MNLYKIATLIFATFITFITDAQQIVSDRKVSVSDYYEKSINLGYIKPTEKGLLIGTIKKQNFIGKDTITNKTINRDSYIAKDVLIGKDGKSYFENRILTSNEFKFKNIKYNSIIHSIQDTTIQLSLERITPNDFFNRYLSNTKEPLECSMSIGGSLFKTKSQYPFPSFLDKVLEFTNDEILWGGSKSEHNKKEFEQKFMGHQAVNSPSTIIKDSLFQVILRKVSPTDNWGLYKNYTIATFTAHGKIINIDSLAFPFIRGINSSGFVNNEKHEAVGRYIIFEKMKAIGAKNNKDSLENRYNFVFFDLTGKVIKKIDFIFGEGNIRELNIYDVQKFGDNFKIINLNSLNSSNPVLQSIKINKNSSLEVKDLIFYNDLSSQSTTIADSRSNGQTGSDNIFGIGNANSIFLNKFFNDKTQETFYVFQAIQDKITNVQTSSSVREYGSIFMLKTNDSFEDFKLVTIEKEKQSIKSKLEILKSNGSDFIFLITDYAQKIINFKDDKSVRTLDINPPYSMMPSKKMELGLKNFVFDDKSKTYFFLYHNVTNPMQSRFLTEKDWFLSFPHLDKVLSPANLSTFLNNEVTLESVGSPSNMFIIEVQLP
jgi:hypothetical protein